MSIARNPKRNQQSSGDVRAESFIAGAAHAAVVVPPVANAGETLRKPVQLRIHEDLLARIDSAAKRRGITRTAFIISSVAEKLEGME